MDAPLCAFGDVVIIVQLCAQRRLACSKGRQTCRCPLPIDFAFAQHSDLSTCFSALIPPSSLARYLIQPLIVVDDEKHSGIEARYFALGVTNEGRRLFVVFTLRTNSIRVISVRDMSKKEQIIYEKKAKSSF